MSNLVNIQSKQSTLIQSKHTNAVGNIPYNTYIIHSTHNCLAKHNHNVIYVATNMTLQHLTYTTRKLHIDLNNYINNKQFVYINTNDQSNDNNTPLFNDINQLYATIKQQCDTMYKQDSNKPIDIIIENLNILLTFNTTADTIDLLQSLKYMTTEQYNGSLIVGCYYDITDDINIIQYIQQYIFNNIITIEPITYGSSKQIHGNIHTIQYNSDYNIISSQFMQSYKHSEQGITLIS